MSASQSLPFFPLPVTSSLYFTFNRNHPGSNLRGFLSLSLSLSLLLSYLFFSFFFFSISHDFSLTSLLYYIFLLSLTLPCIFLSLPLLDPLLSSRHLSAQFAPGEQTATTPLHSTARHKVEAILSSDNAHISPPSSLSYLLALPLSLSVSVRLSPSLSSITFPPFPPPPPPHSLAHSLSHSLTRSFILSLSD